MTYATEPVAESICTRREYLSTGFNRNADVDFGDSSATPFAFLLDRVTTWHTDLDDTKAGL